MKKKSLLAITLTTILLLQSSAIVIGSYVTETTRTKNWTIMFYGCYDTKDLQHFFRFMDNLSMVNLTVKNRKVDIVFLIDIENGSFEGHAIFGNEGRFKLDYIEKINEINTGNSSTLRDFILHCKHKYPAKRYLLVINGHGLGPFGVCPDYNTNGFIGNETLRNIRPGIKDYLTLLELKKSISEAGGVDILFQVSCNLGCIEAAYELRDCVDIYISLESTGYYYSPQISPFVAFSNLIKVFSSINSGNKDSKEVAKEIVDSLRYGYPYVWEPLYGIALSKLFVKFFKDRKNLTIPLRYYIKSYIKLPYIAISAINCRNISTLVGDINNISKDLLRYSKKHKLGMLKIKLYRERSRDFMLGSMVDIGDFFSKFCRFYWKIRSPKIYFDAMKILRSLDKSIIAEYHQIGSRGSHGLSIYFPSHDDPLRKYYHIDVDTYRDQNLSFVKDTYWVDFLKELNN